MSATTIRYLYCDGPLCEGVSEPFDTAPNIDEPIRLQRRRAHSQGWVTRSSVRAATTIKGSLDLCPMCVEESR